MQLESRFPDDADDERDDVDDGAVDGRKKGNGDGTPDDVRVHIGVELDGFPHRHEFKEGPKPSCSQREKAGFFHPGGCFPGNEEQGDQKQRDRADGAGMGGDESVENGRSKRIHDNSFFR